METHANHQRTSNGSFQVPVYQVLLLYRAQLRSTAYHSERSLFKSESKRGLYCYTLVFTIRVM